MRTQLLRCFCTASELSGNPAMVIQGFSGNSEEMQKFTKASGAPACVFILDDHLFRFFYPEIESDLCIHAALCAAKTLLDQTNSTELLSKDKLGNLLAFKRRDKLYQIKTSVKNAVQAPPLKEDIASLLNISKNLIAPNLPCLIASVGSPKLLVPLSTEMLLAELKPNLATIKDWSIQENIAGIYAYVEQAPGVYAARNFNPKTGLTEDIATGVSAGALAAVLAKDMLIYQGHFLGKPSLIQVQYQNPENIWVGGEIKTA